MGLATEDSVGTLLPVTPVGEILRKGSLYEPPINNVYDSIVDRVNSAWKEVDTPSVENEDEKVADECGSGCGKCECSEFTDVLAANGIDSVMQQPAPGEVVELWGDCSAMFAEDCDTASEEYKRFAGETFEEDALVIGGAIFSGAVAALITGTIVHGVYTEVKFATAKKKVEKILSAGKDFVPFSKLKRERCQMSAEALMKYLTLSKDRKSSFAELKKLCTGPMRTIEKVGAIFNNRTLCTWNDGDKIVVIALVEYGGDLNTLYLAVSPEYKKYNDYYLAMGLSKFSYIYGNYDPSLMMTQIASKLEKANKTITEEAEVFTEAAKIDDDMSDLITKLHSKGYKTTASCSGHPGARVKEDRYRDGVLNNKVYSTARVVFNKEYKFKNLPTMWEGRKLPDGKYGIYVQAPNYNINKGMPEELFAKWKSTYMKSLRVWINGLPNAESLVTEEGLDLDTMMDDLTLDSMINIV